MTEGERPIEVRLRPVQPADVPVFREHRLDANAAWAVAFSELDPNDEEAFDARWRMLMGSSEVVLRTVLVDGRVAGNVLKFDGFGLPEVGYWLGREWWGRGVATAAVRAFLAELTERPLYGVVAHENAASIRVLEKCGFVAVGKARALSTIRGVEVDQVVLRLDR